MQYICVEVQNDNIKTSLCTLYTYLMLIRIIQDIIHLSTYVLNVPNDNLIRFMYILQIHDSHKDNHMILMYSVCLIN